MNQMVRLFILSAYFLSACGGDHIDPAKPAADALAELVDEYFEKTLELNPLSATSIGDHRYDDRLANTLGSEYRAATINLSRDYLARLRQIDRAQLSASDQLTYDAFKLSRDMHVEGRQFPGHLLPVDQRSSFATTFVQLGSGSSNHPFNTVKNYDDFLSRIGYFPPIINTAIENMREGIRQGVVQPRVLMEKVLPQLESQLVHNIEDSAFYKPVTSMPKNFGEDEYARLTAAYRTAIEARILPAYQQLADFIRDEYLLATRNTDGLADLPDGAAWYSYLVRMHTTTDLTPDEIHEVGLEEVARIHAEMRQLMTATEFDGSRRDFQEFLKADSDVCFTDAEKYVQAYRDIAESIAVSATKLFRESPGIPLEVRRVEPFREQGRGTHYSRGTPDGSRPGVFYVNAYGIESNPMCLSESLFLHEAIPGHHFQNSIALESEDLPRFRRYGSFTAFGEGWGLYAESLGAELGVFTDPLQKFSALNAELFRSIRLVVDTGLHARGWSRQKTIDYMYNNSTQSMSYVVREADRYMANPGQALAYKIGQLKFRELRTRAEDKLGDKFDIREFHSAVLEDGRLPLNLLETKIDHWIAAQL